MIASTVISDFNSVIIVSNIQVIKFSHQLQILSFVLLPIVGRLNVMDGLWELYITMSGW